ncbi:MAG: DUF421 domain-containing protein [Anaerolineae bacterium]|nr:DUF421 domain-containing protein [Anaerolineae bacterium]
MLFDSWGAILRTVIVGVLAYVLLIVMLRISGKRTLSKMNAFDLIVTVALGSTLATIILSKDVALAEGVAAFLTLILLQYVVTWLSIRSKAVRELVKSTPRLLYYRDGFLEAAMHAERVLEEEIYAAIRAQGIPTLDRVEAVVLETDGSLTVLQKSDGSGTSTLQYLDREGA